MNWINKNIKKVKKISSLKIKQQQFGLLVAVILLIAFSFSIYKQGLQFNLKQQVLLTLIIVISVITYKFSKLFFPLLFVWFFIGIILGEITSFIILAIVYFVLVSPISFFLRKKNKDNQISQWQPKQNTIDYKKLY